jgi:hypothetical protein
MEQMLALPKGGPAVVSAMCSAYTGVNTREGHTDSSDEESLNARSAKLTAFYFKAADAPEMSDAEQVTVPPALCTR